MKGIISLFLIIYLFMLPNLSPLKARINIGIIQALEHQIERLKREVEEKKKEMVEYQEITDSKGEVQFLLSNGDKKTIKVLDEEITDLAVENIYVYLFTDYFGEEGCLFLFDPQGNYLPAITPLKEKIYLTFHRSIYQDLSEVLINSAVIKDESLSKLLGNLFWFISYKSKIEELKDNSNLFYEIDNYFNGFPVEKVITFLGMDLSGDKVVVCSHISNKNFLEADNFFYNFYKSFGYQDGDLLTVMTVNTNLQSKIFPSGLGIVFFLPENILKGKVTTTTINGTVKDSLNNAIPEATLYLHPPVGEVYQTKSSLEGSFTLSIDLFSDKQIFTISAQKEGYQKAWKKIDINSSIDFILNSKNTLPKIEYLKSEKEIICKNETLRLYAKVSDDEIKSLSYKWICESGSIEGEISKAEYTPSTQGEIKITYLLYDKYCRKTEKTLIIKVLSNNAPQISEIKCDPDPPINQGSAIEISCNASDIDNDLLNYLWYWSKKLFQFPQENLPHLQIGKLSSEIINIFKENNETLSLKARITLITRKHWKIEDEGKIYIIEIDNESQNLYVYNILNPESNIFGPKESVKAEYEKGKYKIFCEVRDGKTGFAIDSLDVEIQ